MSLPLYTTYPVLETWWTGGQILLVVVGVMAGITIGFVIYYFLLTRQ